MTPERSFPLDEIRDALGLVRLLYVARKAHGHTASPPASDPLVVVGRELAAALSGARAPAGSAAHRAGAERALRALQQLEGAITLRDDLTDAARAGEARVTRRELPRRGKAGSPTR